jgi:hypothetical protein
MNNNEELSKLLGLDEVINFESDSGKIELLGMMEAHPKGKLFFAKLMYRGQNVEAIDDDGYISRHYITDTTGLLAQAAVEWLTAQKEGV